MYFGYGFLVDSEGNTPRKLNYLGNMCQSFNSWFPDITSSSYRVFTFDENFFLYVLLYTMFPNLVVYLILSSTIELRTGKKEKNFLFLVLPRKIVPSLF